MHGIEQTNELSNVAVCRASRAKFGVCVQSHPYAERNRGASESNMTVTDFMSESVTKSSGDGQADRQADRQAGQQGVIHDRHDAVMVQIDAASKGAAHAVSGRTRGADPQQRLLRARLLLDNTNAHCG